MRQRLILSKILWSKKRWAHTEPQALSHSPSFEPKFFSPALLKNWSIFTDQPSSTCHSSLILGLSIQIQLCMLKLYSYMHRVRIFLLIRSHSTSMTWWKAYLQQKIRAQSTEFGANNVASKLLSRHKTWLIVYSHCNDEKYSLMLNMKRILYSHLNESFRLPLLG